MSAQTILLDYRIKNKKNRLLTCSFNNIGYVRTGRIVVCHRLGTLGSAHSLLCGEKRCENDTRSFSLNFQIRTVAPRASGSNLGSAAPKERKPVSLLGYRFSLERFDKKDAVNFL